MKFDSMTLGIKPACLIIVVCLLSNCKSNTPQAAADEYCSCIIDNIKLNFKSRNDSCQDKVTGRYALLKKWFDTQYNSRMDTIPEDEKREMIKFGLDFTDSVENKCCKAAWGCRPDTTNSAASPDL